MFSVLVGVWRVEIGKYEIGERKKNEDKNC